MYDSTTCRGRWPPLLSLFPHLYPPIVHLMVRSRYRYISMPCISLFQSLTMSRTLSLQPLHILILMRKSCMKWRLHRTNKSQCSPQSLGSTRYPWEVLTFLLPTPRPPYHQGHYLLATWLLIPPAKLSTLSHRTLAQAAVQMKADRMGSYLSYLYLLYLQILYFLLCPQ